MDTSPERILFINIPQHETQPSASNDFISKKKIISESTKNKPCGKLFPIECEDVLVNNMIEDAYGCKIPFFNTGENQK